MRHNMKKISASALAAIMAASTFAYAPVTVQAADPVVTSIPNTTRTEKTEIDGSFLSVTGFAKGNVKDRSEYIGTEYYREVHTEEEFLQALQDARGKQVKVIEVCEDLNLGWNELSSEARAYPIISQFEKTDTLLGTPITNPSMIESGISVLEIDGIDGLTIFSKGGNRIKHVTVKLQAGVNDLIIRNMDFTDVWDWADQRTKGFGKNGVIGDTKISGWAYMKINGAKNVWIDHCDFAVAYDGNVDIENGSSGISFTWCDIGNVDYSVGSMLYKTIAYMEELYQQNQEDSSVGVFRMYKIMREAGMSQEDIANYMGYHQKVHLCGAGDPDSWWIDKVSDNKGNSPLAEPDYTKTTANEYIRTTFAYNHWTNMGSRLPLMRGGVGHLVNNFTDNTPLAEAEKLMKATKDADGNTIQSVEQQVTAIGGKVHFMYNGQDARNGGTIAADTCVYEAVNNPMVGAEYQIDKNDDANYQLNCNGFSVFGYNHSLIVNSMVTNTSGKSYTGSSWDNDGENLFTKGFTWRDKGTINNWSWGLNRVDMTDTDNDGEVNLSYAYQTFPLDSVKENVSKYAGAYTMDMTDADWLKVDYEENTDLKIVDPNQAVPVEKIELSKGEETTIYLEEEFLQLDAIVTPANTTEQAKDYTWVSSNPEVATVNECGLVIPKSVGDTTITVTTPGGKTASCTVHVAHLPTKISIVKPTGEIHVGDTFTLEAKITPADALDTSVTWSSQSQCIQLVDAEKGIFKAVAEGKSQGIRVKANAQGNRVAEDLIGNSTITILAKTITPGDVVGDGDGVTLMDAQYVLKIALRIVTDSELTDDQKEAADVVGNGDGITLKDAQAILKRALRIPVVFDQDQE